MEASDWLAQCRRALIITYKSLDDITGSRDEYIGRVHTRRYRLINTIHSHCHDEVK